MKKQSKLAPLKAEVHACDRFGEVMVKPQLVLTGTYINKGRDKEWYDARRAKLDTPDKFIS